MFAPDALKLGSGVLRDDCLDVFDIILVEGRRVAVLEDHEIRIVLI